MIDAIYYTGKHCNSEKKIESGLILGFKIDSPSDIYWALDGMGFDPYQFVISPRKLNSLSMSWNSIDPNYIHSDEPEELKDFDICHADIFDLHVAKDVYWLQFESEHKLIVSNKKIGN